MPAWKKIVIVVTIIVALVVFVPYIKVGVFDGGTKGWGSIVYTVYNYHTIVADEDDKPKDYKTYEVGWGLAIFGNEVYKNTHQVQEKIED